MILGVKNFGIAIEPFCLLLVTELETKGIYGWNVHKQEENVL